MTHYACSVDGAKTYYGANTFDTRLAMLKCKHNCHMPTFEKSETNLRVLIMYHFNAMRQIAQMMTGAR